MKQLEGKSQLIDGEEIDIEFTDKSYQNLLGKEVNKRLGLMYKRNAGIYVGLNKSKTGWHTPEEIKENDVFKLKHIVEEQVNKFKEKHKRLLSIN